MLHNICDDIFISLVLPLSLPLSLPLLSLSLSLSPSLSSFFPQCSRYPGATHPFGHENHFQRQFRFIILSK